MDFLSFKRFISIEVLIFFYYIGAVFLPVALWLGLRWLTFKFSVLQDSYNTAKQLTWHLLSQKQKLILILFFSLSFIFAELFWRLLFEYLIAFIQMRDALLHLAQ